MLNLIKNRGFALEQFLRLIKGVSAIGIRNKLLKSTTFIKATLIFCQISATKAPLTQYTEHAVAVLENSSNGNGWLHKFRDINERENYWEI